MAQAKDAALRQKIVSDRQTGLSYAELSRRYGVNYHTVRTLCLRFEEEGQEGLRPKYSRCGRKVKPEYEKSFRLVRLVRYLHPLWGVAYILSRIRSRYPDLPLQSVRHYQRRLEHRGRKLPRATFPKAALEDRPRKPHDEWEIDAKERIVLASGEEVCYLNITDAKSGAILKTRVFPLRKDQSGPSGTNSSIDA